MEITEQMVQEYMSQRGYTNEDASITYLVVVEMIKEFAEQQVKLLANPDVVPRISHKGCDCSEFRHKIDRDQFPYGDDIEYDECPKCGARYNLHCL